MPSEPLEELKCLFVGDMYNFAVYREKYDKEVAFISSLGDYFFANKAIKPLAGVWAYGWTYFPDFPEPDKISASHSAFSKELDRMELCYHKDPLSTEK
ncbi:unnamed protein product [Strongylus vulgaris]|uniref:Uncharacterized protein n=1 Tax=Strongylus vulgaris TaxID=40348 RepID=A0A3P7I399_STRVU|nr:unnamed protein product [Strongylus vulgaris]